VAAVYERGGYDAQIDYRQPAPPPALSADEAAWVETILAEFMPSWNQAQFPNQ
ncbi:MAG: DUF4058 family protein, partial [Caldilineaceae bacterium]|nr:DUF4058 family protein [Caldilineaceae bacterium]